MKEKIHFVMRTLRIYSIRNFPICHTAVLTIVITLYIIPLVLIYLITGSVYFLTTFLQSQPLTTSLIKVTF